MYVCISSHCKTSPSRSKKLTSHSAVWPFWRSRYCWKYRIDIDWRLVGRSVPSRWPSARWLTAWRWQWSSATSSHSAGCTPSSRSSTIFRAHAPTTGTSTVSTTSTRHRYHDDPGRCQCHAEVGQDQGQGHRVEYEVVAGEEDLSRPHYLTDCSSFGNFIYALFVLSVGLLYREKRTKLN